MSEPTTSIRKKTATLRDRLFVPGEFVTEEILEAYKVNIPIGIDEETGEQIFDTINHYQIQYISSDTIIYSFNRGDLNKMYRIFHDFEIIDERVSAPMKAKLKIRFSNGKGWRDYQPDAIEALLQHEYGLLKAPPRAGKSLLIAATICMEREKSIIFAHQTDLLVQMYETFKEFTNLVDLQTPDNKIVGFAESIEDFDKLDVVLCTKQTFDHVQNKITLAAIQRMFGSIFVDEAHVCNAEVYSKLVNRFWAKCRRGVTATPKRKDGLDVVVDGIIGPVIHEISPAQTQQVPIDVQRINTNLKVSSRIFSRMLTILAENKGRNELIIRHMLEDLKLGRIIVAVTDRREHQEKLQKLLQDKGVKVEVFNGSTNNKETRKKTLDKVRNKESQVLLTMRSMTTGLDIPCADTFYNLLPSANAVRDGAHAGEGGYEQQCTRIRTPYPGKKKGWIRDFVDGFGIAYACWNERKKTYEKIGATILKLEEDLPEIHGFQHLDDGLGGLMSEKKEKTIVYGDVEKAEDKSFKIKETEKDSPQLSFNLEVQQGTEDDAKEGL